MLMTAAGFNYIQGQVECSCQDTYWSLQGKIFMALHSEDEA